MIEELFLSDDVNWEEEDEIVEDSGKVRFAKARLYYPLNVDRFVKVSDGGVFTLPGVFYDEFDSATQTSQRVGLKEFRGMKLNPKSKFAMALLVFEFDDQHGKPYQRHLKMGLWSEKNDEGEKRPNLWNEHQKAEIAKLTSKQRNDLVDAARKDTWVYISYQETATGYTFEFDPKSYASDIKVYKDVAEWQQANEAHFAQFNQNGQTPSSYYPDDWGNAIEDMINHGKTLDHSDHTKLAEELQLLVNGQPAQTADGENCNVRRILAEVMDCPEPMVKI